MRNRVLMSLVLLFCGMTAPAVAGTRISETWQVTWSGGSCTFVLKYDKAELAGPVKVQKPCGKLLRKVKSFVYTDESRRDLILFTRKNARGEPVGIFERSGKNKMTGMAGDGEPVSMFNSASSSVSVNVGASGSSGGSGAASDCIVYADDRSCAHRADLKNPKVPTFETLDMLALTNQSIYPFSGGGGFAKDEKMQGGACYQIKKCEKAFSGKGDWCEVVLKDGFFTGWVKRMDADMGYLQKGC